MNVHLCMLVKVLYLTDYFTFLMWCDNCANECAPVQVGHGVIIAPMNAHLCRLVMVLFSVSILLFNAT